MGGRSLGRCSVRARTRATLPQRRATSRVRAERANRVPETPSAIPFFFFAREKSSARAGDRYAIAAVRGEDEREREEQREEMNTFDVQDPSEEPGYPTLATTPRSIRNMEALITTAAVDESPPSPTLMSSLSPRTLNAMGSPKKAKSMKARDVWDLGKGTAGPRSYGSFSKVTANKWDNVRPGEKSVWEE